MPLGRGLGALIPTKKAAATLKDSDERVLNIEIDLVEPNPEQPRKNFSHLEMEELINSIQENGIIQPLIVTKVGDRQYQIIAGERRWRAAKFLELKTVPAIARSFKDNQKLEISLIENIQRKDLNPLERARAYQRLIDEFNLTQEQVAKKMGKARSSIANTLRLLTLPEIIQEAIKQEKIKEGHAKALLAADSEEKQKALLKRILGLGLTVREAGKMALGQMIRKRVELDPQLLEAERELSGFLNTKVKIIKQGRKSKIIIEAYNDQDLEELIKKIIK